jgi:pentatricopeptide repeat protein
LEQLGNYERALTVYQEAKDKGFSAGGKALSEFKKRLKKIQKK